jgi:hypothetical protein
MKLQVLCCEVFFREVCALAANSPHTIDVAFLPKGLHDLGVERMVPRLQEQIDARSGARSGEGYDAIVLVYGLCNNGIVGLEARDTRLVLARAHDCITLFMGDRQRYLDYFHAHPGTYYRTTGWLEHADSTGAGEETVSQKLGMAMRYEELVQKYGEDNAQYIREMLGDWTQNYNRLTYIHMGLECEAPFREMARREAEERGWTFDEVQGSMTLLRKAIHGEWDEDFLIVEPGQRVVATHDDGIIAARELSPSSREEMDWAPG